MPHLYKPVVLPSILYGCKLWSHMNQSDHQQFNTLPHFICKNSLYLPKLCRSDISVSLFNGPPITSTINTRKLLLLGRLCRLDCKYSAKYFFSDSLAVIFTWNIKQAKRIYSWHYTHPTIQFYNFLNYLRSWLDNGSFCPFWYNLI